MRTVLLSTLVLASVFLSACAPAARPKEGYYGPTDSMSKVVADINANNQKIPSLWASHYYEATIKDKANSQSHFVNGDGLLLYQSPMNLRLLGQKELVGTVFEVGSNSRVFWVKILPEVSTLWIGNYADVTEEAIERNQIPIRPDMILQVLGVGTIDTNVDTLPAPTMRFNNDFDAYMIVWNARLPERWFAQREVWYDRKTKRPSLVILFDTNGRAVLRATLSQHRQVEVTGVDKKDWPWVAGDYKLFFPDTGSKMEITLRDVMVSKTQGRFTVPSSKNFVAPDPQKADVNRVVEIR